MKARPKIICVATNDFGELGSVYSFGHGIKEAELFLCIPPHLQKAAHPSATIYNDGENLYQYIRQIQADLVIFFSGYLLATGGLMPLKEALNLIRKLKNDHIRLATGDPFLGLPPSLNNPKDFDLTAFRIPTRNPLTAVRKRLAEAKIRKNSLQSYTALQEELANVPHLYPIPIEKEGWHGPSKFYCFCNLNLGPIQRDESLWIFVISRLDSNFQISQKKEHAISRRLSEALEQFGKQVVLIAPKDVAASLNPQVTSHPKFQCHASLPHQEFTELISQAGKAFYWNAISQSILLRVYQGAETHFFDHGHLRSLLPQSWTFVNKYYYRGIPPDLLKGPLSSEALENSADQCSASFEALLAKLRECPTPDEVIKKLLDAP